MSVDRIVSHVTSGNALGTMGGSTCEVPGNTLGPISRLLPLSGSSFCLQKQLPPRFGFRFSTTTLSVFCHWALPPPCFCFCLSGSLLNSELVSGVTCWPCPSLPCGLPGFPLRPHPVTFPFPGAPSAYPGMPCACHHPWPQLAAPF